MTRGSALGFPLDAVRHCALRTALAAAALVVLGCASTPAYLTMPADELWETGTAAYEDGNWDRTIERLERFVTTSPGDPRVPEARMLVARSYVGRREYLTAASEFERFLQLHPNHGLAPEASLGICEAYGELSPIPQRDQAYTRRAVVACDQTGFEFAGLSVATEADSIGSEMVDKLAEADFQDAQFYADRVPVSAPALFEFVVERYPDTDWAPRALLEMYRIYQGLEWIPEAEETVARLLTEYPDSEPAQALRTELAEQGRDPPDGG